jgi:hypothetical protein
MTSINTSNKSDWLYNDERGIFTNIQDVNLRIEVQEIDFDRDQFGGEDWATKHPDSSAYRRTYSIYYNASFIKEFVLVDVDGFRATLPMPKINTNIVSKQDYKFAEIVDYSGTLTEYMRRAGLEVES